MNNYEAEFITAIENADREKMIRIGRYIVNESEGNSKDALKSFLDRCYQRVFENYQQFVKLKKGALTGGKGLSPLVRAHMQADMHAHPEQFPSKFDPAINLQKAILEGLVDSNFFEGFYAEVS